MSAADRFFQRAGDYVRVNDGGQYPDETSLAVYVSQDQHEEKLFTVYLTVSAGPLSFSSHMTADTARLFAANLLAGAQMVEAEREKVLELRPAEVAP